MTVRTSSWSYVVNLSPSDTMRARAAISEELHYYNGLVEGFSGPIRTMGSLLKTMTGRWEMLLCEIAGGGYDVRRYKRDTLPDALKPYTDLIFTPEGALAIDLKTLLLLDVGRAAGEIAPAARKAMASEMLRAARDQSAAFANTLNREDQVYKFAVETLSPLDSKMKRHLQLPRSACKTAELAGTTAIMLPYLSAPLHVASPPVAWNYLYLRDSDDPARSGQWNLELAKETFAYALKRTDSFSSRKKRARGA